MRAQFALNENYKCEWNGRMEINLLLRDFYRFYEIKSFGPDKDIKTGHESIPI